MRVCKGWREAARAHYLLLRVLRVPSQPDALLRAYRRARAGDTLCLEDGLHHLSTEMTIERPVRLLSETEATRLLGAWQPEGAPPFALLRPAEQRSTSTPTHGRGSSAPGAGGSESSDDDGGGATDGTGAPAARHATYADAVTSGEAASGAVLAGAAHVLLRMRCPTHVAGLTLCRMGDEVGYPNAVAYAEAGALRMERCRVTCGGAATSVSLALQAFAGAPEPGAVWPEERPSGAPVHDAASQSPQSGVWVGAAATVELRKCTIANCMGPGIKIYRGRLLAQQTTIAFSSRGANVVANGGQVVLERNEIRGATGDGISSWNNSVMRIEHNSIHGNSGAGIAVNTGGGAVTIAHNDVFDNLCQPVLFATSANQATVTNNDFHGGRVVGCGLTADATPDGYGTPIDPGMPMPPPPCLSRMPSSRTTLLGSSWSGSSSSDAGTPTPGRAASSASPSTPGASERED
jgi:hypothetical protein